MSSISKNEKEKKTFQQLFCFKRFTFWTRKQTKKSCSRRVAFLCSLFFLLVSWSRNSFVFFAARHYLFLEQLKTLISQFQLFCKTNKSKFFLLSLQTENFFLAFLLVFQVENGPKRQTLVKKKEQKQHLFKYCPKWDSWELLSFDKKYKIKFYRQNWFLLNVVFTRFP